jgi:hypothetical protein
LGIAALTGNIASSNPKAASRLGATEAPRWRATCHFAICDKIAVATLLEKVFLVRIGHPNAAGTHIQYMDTGFLVKSPLGWLPFLNFFTFTLIWTILHPN